MNSAPLSMPTMVKKGLTEKVTFDSPHSKYTKKKVDKKKLKKARKIAKNSRKLNRNKK